jgi:hypothetical protein
MKIKIKIIKEFLGIKYHKNILLTFNQAKMIEILRFLEISKKKNFDL